MGHCNPCASTASAALMNAGSTPIFMLGSRAGSMGCAAIFSKHVLNDFVQHFRFYRFLHEMTRSPAAMPPQCSPDNPQRTP